MSFAECRLDGEKAAAISPCLEGWKSTLKEVDFSRNYSLPADAWKQLLGSLKGGIVEKMSFAECGLDGQKAAAIAPCLEGLKSTLKEVDFSWNDFLPADAWKQLL